MSLSRFLQHNVNVKKVVSRKMHIRVTVVYCWQMTTFIIIHFMFNIFIQFTLLSLTIWKAWFERRTSSGNSSWIGWSNATCCWNGKKSKINAKICAQRNGIIVHWGTEIVDKFVDGQFGVIAGVKGVYGFKIWNAKIQTIQSQVRRTFWIECKVFPFMIWVFGLVFLFVYFFVGGNVILLCVCQICVDYTDQVVYIQTLHRITD